VGEHTWSGVFAATLCPFKEDYSLDEGGLRAYARYLASVDGIKGLVCNGHTGEVMGLRPAERARVTQIFADEVGDKVNIVSGVCAEGSFEAIDHALAAKEAGADAILLMPPHHWLRFGRSSKTAVGFFEDGQDPSSRGHQDGHPGYVAPGTRLSGVETRSTRRAHPHLPR